MQYVTGRFSVGVLDGDRNAIYFSDIKIQRDRLQHRAHPQDLVDRDLPVRFDDQLHFATDVSGRIKAHPPRQPIELPVDREDDASTAGDGNAFLVSRFLSQISQPRGRHGS